MDTRIRAIKKAAQELKTFSGGIQAVDRNADQILASVKMLEINITDLSLTYRNKNPRTPIQPNMFDYPLCLYCLTYN